jgi:hypothetical protein
VLVLPVASAIHIVLIIRVTLGVLVATAMVLIATVVAICVCIIVLSALVIVMGAGITVVMPLRLDTSIVGMLVLKLAGREPDGGGWHHCGCHSCE